MYIQKHGCLMQQTSWFKNPVSNKKVPVVRRKRVSDALYLGVGQDLAESECIRRWRETPTSQVMASRHQAGETTFLRWLRLWCHTPRRIIGDMDTDSVVTEEVVLRTTVRARLRINNTAKRSLWSLRQQQRGFLQLGSGDRVVLPQSGRADIV